MNQESSYIQLGMRQVYHPSQIVQAPFGMAQADRRSHLYVIGKTGMGKTRLIQSMIAQDLLNGRAVGLIDPHGDLAWEILDAVPPQPSQSPFPRPSPQGTPEALPSPILRRLSSTSHSHAALRTAWGRGAAAGLQRGAGRTGVSGARCGRRRGRWGAPGGRSRGRKKGFGIPIRATRPAQP